MIEISLTNKFSEANFNVYKRILNWQPFMKRVYYLFLEANRFPRALFEENCELWASDGKMS